MSTKLLVLEIYCGILPPGGAGVLLFAIGKYIVYICSILHLLHCWHILHIHVITGTDSLFKLKTCLFLLGVLVACC